MKILLILLFCAGAYAWQKAAGSLPAPFATPTVSNGPTVISRPDGAQLKVPPGFTVESFATGFLRPRFMMEGPGGEVLISDTVANGSVSVLKGKDKKVLLEGLDRPYSLALWKDYLYLGEPTSIKRYKYDSAAMTAGPGKEIVPLPGFTKGHVTRTIVFSKDAGKMRLYPGTNQLWTTVEERNNLSDGLVADYFTSVKPGGFYGWPYAYLGKNPDPRIKEQHLDLVQSTIKPDIILEPHVAVLDFLFYTGSQFPAEFQGGAFLANHGSSNRSTRTRYSVSFVPFENGKPSGPVRDFLTGFMLSPDQKEVWGRPLGLLQMKDGSLLVSDDGGKMVWRVAHYG